MSKLVQLTLAKVRYNGDAIGDDIRIEIELPNGFFAFNKQIKHESEVPVNALVGVFSGVVTIPLTLRVIEQDIVFNDIGSKGIALNVDLNATLPQTSNHEIVVKEQRGMRPGTRNARFIVTLEVLVGSTMRYIPLTDDGWFVCRKEATKKRVSLPAYVRVRFNRVDSGREYFSIMEGAWLDAQMSVLLNRDASLQLLFESPQTDSVQLMYSISKKTLAISNKTYKTTDSPDAPWEKGRYDVEIPDAPHRGGLNYPSVKYGRVWFRIGHSGDRYLHTGRHSLGCITVTEPEHWDALCQILLKARKGDGKSIGVLTVTD